MDMENSFLAVILVWGVFAGVVFSSVGAAGGILASFGLISIVGITDPNSVKPMTQIVVLATALVFIPGYLRRSALVWPLGMLLAGGGLIGAWIGSSLSSTYLTDMKTFRPLFGILTLAIATQIAWPMFKTWNKNNSGEIANEGTCSHSVSNIAVSRLAVSFSYNERDYRIGLWSPFLAGFLISTIAAVFGVGGGFLLVPYMSSLLRMPMHIIPATAGIAITISLLVSIGNYLSRGANLEMQVLVFLAAGSILGAIIGPFVNDWMKNSWLNIVLFLIILMIGLKYIFV